MDCEERNKQPKITAGSSQDSVEEETAKRSMANMAATAEKGGSSAGENEFSMLFEPVPSTSRGPSNQQGSIPGPQVQRTSTPIPGRLSSIVTWPENFDWAAEFDKIKANCGDSFSFENAWAIELPQMVSNIRDAVNAAESSVEITRGLIYDAQNRISRLDSQEKRTEATLVFYRQNEIPSNQQKLIELMENCKAMLEKIDRNLPSRAGRPPIMEPLNKRKRPNDHASQVEKTFYTTEDGEYTLLLVATRETRASAVSIFYEAMRRVRIQVKQATPRGPNAKISLRSLEDLELAEAALLSHKLSGEPLTDSYQVERKITSKFVLLTEKFGRKVQQKLPYAKDGKVNIKLARTEITTRNPTIFDAEEDLINVEVKTVTEGDRTCYKLLLFCTRRALNNALSEDNRKTTIDLEFAQVRYKDVTRDEICFKCLKMGHYIAQCREKYPKCKFCFARDHPSGKCKMRKKKELFECHKCREYNLKQTEPSKRRNENHAALDSCCLTTREERAEAQKQRKNRR